MGYALTLKQREKILGFDPGGPVTVSDFCRAEGISRTVFYRLRNRSAELGASAALRPLSRAPRAPHRRFGPWLDQAIEQTWRDLKEEGWDNGPWSIWWRLLQQVPDTAVSRSTIARRLRALGLSRPTPGKRPKSSYRRWARAMANELWQLDGIKWQLADGTDVTLYQIIDDCTRVLTVLTAAIGGERSTDAITAVKTAIDGYGLPAAVLTDNGNAFNQHRKGQTAALERWLAVRGIRPISGRVSHPQTQGKIERAHQPLEKWLRARPAAESLTHLNTLLAEFLTSYNHHRQHQGLGLRTTPMMAWNSVTKAQPLGRPIDMADLYGTQPLRLPPAPQQPRLRSRTIPASGRFSHQGIVINFGRDRADQQIHLITDTDQVEVFDTNGELLATIPWPPARATAHATISLTPGSPFLAPNLTSS